MKILMKMTAMMTLILVNLHHQDQLLILPSSKMIQWPWWSWLRREKFWWCLQQWLVHQVRKTLSKKQLDGSPVFLMHRFKLKGTCYNSCILFIVIRFIVWWHVGVNNYGYCIYFQGTFRLEPCLSYSHCIVHFWLKKNFASCFFLHEYKATRLCLMALYFNKTLPLVY